jgi:NAD-dependent deacetylase
VSPPATPPASFMRTPRAPFGLRVHGQREMNDRLVIDDRTRLMVLTGAGVSAESGLPTFRDANGLWENHAVEQVASPEGFRENPELVWRFYSQRRAAAKRCEPNAGHRALAKIEKRLGDRFLLATQNVDGLHARAGNERVIELHGNIFTSRCSCCDRAPFADDRLYEADLPECEACRAKGRRELLRPHIVWFGEALFPESLEHIDSFLTQAAGTRLLFLAVGTSGVVYPAAGLVQLARRRGAETWLVNAERAENATAFDHFVQGRSAELLPALLAVA